MNVVDRLLAALNARIERFANSRDPSVFADAATAEEARRLLAAAQPADGDPRSLRLDVLTTLAHVYLFRYQALPEGRGVEDLLMALKLFDALEDRAPERISDYARRMLAAAQPQAPASEAERLTFEAAEAVAEYQRTGRFELLDVAVTAARDAVSAISPGDPDSAIYQSNLRNILQLRFEQGGDVSDMDAAIDAMQQAVTATPPGAPELAQRLSDLAGSMFARFQRSGGITDLNAAISAVKQAITVTAPDHRDRPGYLSNLGNLLRSRFELSRDIADLDAAIGVVRQAVSTASSGDPNQAAYLSNLGGSLRKRFEWTGNTEDLDAAIEATLQAVTVTPPGHAYRPMTLSSLSGSLRARFEQTGDTADLDAAIEAAQQAVTDTPIGHPQRDILMTTLGNALRERYHQVGASADLDAAIEADQRAAASTPPDHPRHPGVVANLANGLLDRYQRDADPSDLDAAIHATRQALATTAPGNPSRILCMASLGNALLARFQHNADRADLDAAINAVQQAVLATPPGHPDRASYLSNLDIALVERFQWAGDMADIDAAIDAGREAVAAALPGHPPRASYLSNLGNAMRARFERTGGSADLDTAIDVGQEAVAATPPGHPARGIYLSNLGASLGTRFQRAGDPTDLDAAIDAAQQAVDTTPPHNPNRPYALSNLANALSARFERTKNSTDLDAAIDAAQQAVDTTPPNNPERPRYLSNLGTALDTRFDHTGDPVDLDAAIAAGRKAVAAAPPGHPGHVTYLSNLGASLLTRFRHTGDHADLDAAIDTGRKAVAASPPGHPNQAAALLNLANALGTRFKQSQDEADLDAAIGFLEQASLEPTAIPSVRLTAAQLWGATAAGARQTHAAAEGYAVAVGLLPTVAWHGLDRSVREEQLAEWAGLAADAAACAVLDDRPQLAVELLEQGRSVLWTQALNMRHDLTRLAEKAPHLAERLDAIRVILDNPMPEAAPPAQWVGTGAPVMSHAPWQRDAVEERKRKAREWDDLLAQVRMLDGFEHFLTATPFAELSAVATEGPVVIVNASDRGCHALIVSADSQEVGVVPLPDMSLEAVVDRGNALLQALAGAANPGRGFADRERDRHAILDVLDWLWDVIAEPVLTTLGHTSAPGTGDPWPRVWWCPTGPLTVMPIHAAGQYPRFRTAAAIIINCVSEHVISSYAPTLTALARSRARVSAPVRQLTIGMPTTPGHSPLPAVPAELKVLARYFPPDEVNHQLAGSQATCAAVLGAIPTHSWVHLACHASQQQIDPTRSGFALWDAAMTIADLAKEPSDSRDLAFLSACQTVTGSARHLDEAIHLAAVMQFLGYRHVIATMWTIADSPAPYVADAVYSALIVGGEADSYRTAEALHRAICALRNAEPTNPLIWAPYIHLGP